MQDEIVLFPEPPPGEEMKFPKHNLPLPLTPLIGREREVKALCALLQRPEVRLVTLAGTGGVGKTRLALEIGSEMRGSFADGVHFVSLAPVRDPNLVISTITRVLALKEVPNQSLLELLKAFLSHKSTLLLLDNFEQIIDAAPLLSDLLATCSSLKILVTSRSVLHLRGEHEFLVSPLALPDLTTLPTSEVLAQYSAVALFLQRVHATLPAFQMLPGNARSIAEVCVYLDGLPLALELAAARMKLFTPQALLARLGHLLPLLTSGARDAPERQQTLRQTIAWSYHLLTSEEQRLFRSLSVFVGGCTLETIETLWGTRHQERAVADVVTMLLDQNLVQVIRQEGEEPRFVMLETIREYGLECLEHGGELETIQQVHAEYYLALAEEVEPHLISAQQFRWLQHLEQEYNNLRAALDWFLAAQQYVSAMRLSGALWIFFSIHLKEGRIWFERVLATG
ncbi:MAG: protein kinase, partial [Chloroflexi bacterium]|nr:protein kinase [Chloroflexota bacterium]